MADAPSPPPLSVAIVCKDNERTIGRTLDSVAGLASEIVAVDSGSTDGTIGLLERAGARVIRSPWLGYVRTKQKALDACEQPWALCLDSDESVEPDLARAVRDALASDPADVAGYQVNRKVWWAGDFLHHAWQPEWRLRLVRRDQAHWVGEDPHDRLEPIDSTARVARLAGDLRHDSFQTMAEYLRKNVSHSVVSARSHLDAGRGVGVLRLATSPVGAWLKQMVVRQAWRDGWRGWAAASATAVATLMKHLVLLEAARTGSRPGDAALPAAAADNEEEQ